MLKSGMGEWRRLVNVFSCRLRIVISAHTIIIHLIQMAFVVVFLQELIVGKGVIEGIQEGNIFNYIMLGAFAVSTLGLTAFLAIKGSDDLTTKGIE
jgi:uncharacterized membrane protein